VIMTPWRFGSLIALAAFASPAVAGLLPDDEVTEMMMEMEGAEATIIARYFPPTGVSNLPFTNQLNVSAKTLSFQTAPGAVYEGMPVTLSASAAFDNGDGKWHLTSTVAVGTYGWHLSGFAQALPPPDPSDPPYIDHFDVDWSALLPPLIPPPNPVPFDYSSNISYTNTAAQTISEATINFSQFGINLAQTVAYDHLTTQGPDKGKWEWNLPAANENGNAFRVNGQGITPLLDGPGSSTFQIAPVPEPGGFLLCAVSLFLSCVLPVRKRTSLVRRACR
jgi:hypothetical protein